MGLGNELEQTPAQYFFGPEGTKLPIQEADVQ